MDDIPFNAAQLYTVHDMQLWQHLGAQPSGELPKPCGGGMQVPLPSYQAWRKLNQKAWGALWALMN